MGSSSSKFRKHLQSGDEYAALQLYNSNADLRKALDPNSSYGDNYHHDTPLHLASRHAMKSLLRIFLFELGGNPNKKNGRNETALHGLCLTPHGSNFVVQQRRSECLSLVLQWKGAKLQDGQVERAELGAQDEKLNTALHYAAASGLKRCVELLVSHNAPLFTENAQKQTPCDCAERNGKNQIALFLESKMVFSSAEEESADEDALLDQIDSEEGYSGLRAQDLQEAKDQLLVETSDMLQVPLFTAEALLRNHEWSREMLLEAWMNDPFACCEKCGVVPPASVVSEPSADLSLTPSLPPSQASTDTEVICDICACAIPGSEEPVSMTCDHQFCRSCWERYLTGKITEGEAHNIFCPGYQCCRLVPVDVIETLVSRDMARRYLQFDIKAFVDSNPSIKWCPFPGCGRAVRLPDSDNPLSPSFRGMNDMSSGTEVSHAVDCGNGHIFCWECLGEAHEPASCDKWQRWLQKVAETKPEEMSGTEEETEVAANCLWLVTNSKPCPNCKSPIQKNEGCNHMKCSKCKHDFCWVCLEAWKKHSSATGGYFRCNRYEVVKRVGEYSDMLKAEAEARNQRLQELNRFVHYYTRFKNHENSFRLEEPLVSTAKEKMMALARAVVQPPEAGETSTKFVEEAVQQLLKARRVLKCSYVYGYYLEDTGYRKPIFEFMQTELEECTETLSEMIARPYLRTPRARIIQTALLVQRKRHEFVAAIGKGLVPPDTSPAFKKRRKKYSVELDEDLRKALMASIQDLDPANPWVKDPSGRHTNVSALLDWPEESDESDAEPDAPRPLAEGAQSNEPPPPPACPTCARHGCTRPRAQNPRTGTWHDFCSLRCLRLQRSTAQDAAPPTDAAEEAFTDYQLDLLRALEMSRLQFLREMGSLRPGSGDRSPPSPLASPRGAPREPSPVPLVLSEPPRGRCLQPPRPAPAELGQEVSLLSLNDEDRDLRLAIELSLQPDERRQVRSASCLVPGPSAFPFLDSEYSSVVTRVPNKSVEDLTSGACASPPRAGACASPPPRGGACASSPPRGGACASPPISGGGSAPSANPFGLLKDISVSNILPSDTDKTRAFAQKDFRHVFGRNGASSMEQVFEPRPPPPLSRQDPWLPRGEEPQALPREGEEEETEDMEALDPADIVISSEVLESLLQGAELYTHQEDDPAPLQEAADQDDNSSDSERKGVYV